MHKSFHDVALARIRSLRIGLVLLLVLAVTLSGGSSARALCTRGGCHGLDPATSGCAAGAYTVAVSNNYLWQLGSVTNYVQLRYSPNCVANWSRSYTWDGLSGWRSILADMAYVSGFTFALPTSNGYNSVYTNMVDGGVYQCAKGAMKNANSPWYYGPTSYPAMACG